eukprot:756974-Hanusia_phi.AAC.3
MEAGGVGDGGNAGGGETQQPAATTQEQPVDPSILLQVGGAILNPVQVLHVRMAGDDPATAFRFDRTRFAFVQFHSKEQADIAMNLSGTILGGLPIKCGPAKNPIVQPRSVLPSAGQAAGVDDSALEMLKAAQERIAAKISAKTQKSEGVVWLYQACVH